MRAADHLAQHVELLPAQLAAIRELRELRGLLRLPPADGEGSVSLGIFLALEHLARRGPEFAGVAVAEGRSWLNVLGARLPERTAP